MATTYATLYGALTRFAQSIIVPAITSGAAYASGNSIGGLLVLPNLVQGKNEEVLLRHAEISDNAGQGAAIDLLLFDSDPSASTFTDKSAIAVAKADLAKLIDVVQFPAASYIAGGTPKFQAQRLLRSPLLLADGNLYAALVSRGTPTFTSVSDIVLKLWAEQRP